MALTYHDARRLWEARLAGTSFDEIATFGRQQLYLHPAEVKALQRDYRARNGQAAIPLQDYAFGEYADRFWTEFLEAKSVATLDYSDYEGAAIVHDMNTPVPESLHGRFDAVIEAGSLEHVFQFPTAIRNLMLMTKKGGSLFLTTVANNLCGHGFYQFSPELMFRIFCPENGFAPPRVVFLEALGPSVELRPIRGIYQVTDPAATGGRVGLQSPNPILMMVDAQRISETAPFQSNPQQSDYVASWHNEVGAASKPSNRNGLLKEVYRALPATGQRFVQNWMIKRRYSLENRRFYTRLG